MIHHLLYLLLFVFPGMIQAAGLSVFVSVLPLQGLVEAVGGEEVEVNVMVGPGKTPATYEPSPKQMARLSEAEVFFRVGVPFEQIWMERLRDTNPRMQVVDLREAVEVLAMDHHGGVDHDHHHGDLDPHIWTDPLKVQQMARKVRDILITTRPDREADFEANYGQLSRELSELNQELVQLFAVHEGKEFLVFHPAWGYFAERYHLKQLVIEYEGKEPGGQSLAKLIDEIKAKGIRTVFVQPQFSQRSAHTLATALDAELVVLDPLFREPVDGLRGAARLIAKAFAQNG